MSEIPPPPSPKKEVIAPRQESIAEEFADDPPNPEPNYGEARLWLVARDPHCLFAYWEFRVEEHPDAIAHDGRARFFLRFFREDGAVESSAEIRAGTGNVFVPAQSPDTAYSAELGFFEGDIWCFVARSGTTRTPPVLLAEDSPPVFATIPSRVSLGKLGDLLAASALPGESLAMTAARVQGDARDRGAWTQEHEDLLAEILGAGAGELAGNSITLTRRIQLKLEAAASAAAPGEPIPVPCMENGASSPGGGGPVTPLT